MAESLEQRAAEEQRDEDEKQKLLGVLNERVKELTALYGVSHLLQEDKPIADVLQAVVACFPAAWQYPEITAARVVFDGVEAATPNFVPTQWMQTGEFRTRDGARGAVEICYLESRPDEDEGPFLREERSLLNSLCQMLRVFLERRGAEDRLKESEERFRSAFDHAPIGMALVAPDGRWTRVNRSLCQIVGYSEQELLNMRFQTITHPEDLETDLTNIRRVLDGEVGSYQLEKRYVHKLGHEVWILLSVSLIRSPNGDPLHLVAQVLDTTERRRMEESLRHALGRLNTLMDIARAISATLDLSSLLARLTSSLVDSIPAADIGVIFLDESQDQTLVPKASVGFDEERLRQLRIIPGEGISGQAFQTGIPVLGDADDGDSEGRVALSHVDDRMFSLAHRNSGIKSAVSVPLLARGEGAIIGTITLGAMHAQFSDDDLTLLAAAATQTSMAIQNAQLYEQTRISQDRLRALSHRLVETQEAERRYIAHELHDEIGQALTLAKVNIHAISRLPEAGAVRPNLKECTDIVDEALQHVRGMCVELRPSVLDDLGLAAAVRWCVFRYAKQGGFEAKVHDNLAGPPLPPALETTCFRIVQEALTNVVRHAKAHQVVVRIGQRGRELHLLVQDDGIGFDVDEALTRASSGSSIGLLGIQERASLVEGHITIDSTPERGTRIRGRFPLAAARPGEKGDRGEAQV